MSLSLSDLPTGMPATVLALHVGKKHARRMAGMGFRPGMPVRVVRRSPFHGPLQIRVGHTDVIMRRMDAARIEVLPQTGQPLPS
ncbi:MAG: FeoA family protein [Thiobacillaceae bacterium]